MYYIIHSNASQRSNDHPHFEDEKTEVQCDVPRVTQLVCSRAESLTLIFNLPFKGSLSVCSGVSLSEVTPPVMLSKSVILLSLSFLVCKIGIIITVPISDSCCMV